MARNAARSASLRPSDSSRWVGRVRPQLEAVEKRCGNENHDPAGGFPTPEQLPLKSRTSRSAIQPET